jgi:hypothetical protein
VVLKTKSTVWWFGAQQLPNVYFLVGNKIQLLFTCHEDTGEAPAGRNPDLSDGYRVY